MTSTANAQQQRSISFGLALGWGVGTLGISVMFNTTNFLLLRYMTDFLGIAAATGGLILLASKLYDTVTDPLMGWLSDRTRGRLGRRRPYLLLGGVICAVAFYALFHAPSLDDSANAVLIMLLLAILYSTGYTVFNVPYMAMPAEMTPHYHERSFLVQFRVYAIAVGTLVGGFGAPFLVASYGGGRDGHGAMAAILAAVILATSVLCFFATGRARATAPESTAERAGWSERLALFLGNRPFLLLLGVKFFQLLSLAISQTVLTFFVVRVIGQGYTFLGTYLLLSSVAMFVSTPIWLALSRRRGKVQVYLVASVIYAAIALSWYWATAVDGIWQFHLRALISGFASGGMLLMGQAMLPDTIAWDAVRSGSRREGIFAGVYTSAEKLAFAVGSALAGLFLGAMGYVESTGGFVEQPDSALFAIRLCMSWLPMLLTVVSCAFLLGYDLDEDRLASVQGAVGKESEAEVAPEARP